MKKYSYIFFSLFIIILVYLLLRINPVSLRPYSLISIPSLLIPSPYSLTSSSSSLTPTPYLVKVTRIIDGDTIVLENKKTVRYIGIDTPEIEHQKTKLQCFGEEASKKNKELVLGKMVRLEKDVSEIDRYGRLLRYVYLDNIFINEYLVRQGFAYVATFPPDVKYHQLFVAAQEEARVNKRGFWNKCPPK